jgi:hypothetical protein
MISRFNKLEKRLEDEANNIINEPKLESDKNAG